MMSDAPEERSDARPLLGSFVGMGGMACVLFVVLFSGEVAPWWAVLAMSLGWLVVLAVGTRWFMHHPWRVAMLPVAMLAIWLGTIAAGVAFLDWTA